jgi:hypothetical protein
MNLSRELGVTFVVMVLAVIVAILSGWLKRPQWLTRARVVVILAAALVAGTVWTVLAADGGTTPDPVSGLNPNRSQATLDSQPPPTSRESPPFRATPRAGTALSGFMPSTGGDNIVTIPRPLVGLPPYKSAIAIRCGSGQIGDSDSQVTYDLDARYIEFDTGAFAYDPEAEDKDLELEVFADNKTVAKKIIHIGQSTGAFSVAVDEVQILRLDVTCETPNAFIVLTAPSIVHQ